MRVALLALAAAAIMLASAVCAQVGLRILAPASNAVHLAVPAAERPPVASLARVAAEAPPALASPASGTTGTIELPPVPVGAVPEPVTPNTITPARPFSLAGVAPVDRGRALECLTAAIYYEAASEPDDGQRAVAQVILNRVRHPVFPASVCGVVYQGSERAGCQFSFACDGAMARVPSRSGWARAARVAAAALNGYVFAPVGLATHYHTYAVTPAWNRTLVMTDAIGAHFFHRWKGYWGTPGAFSQAYARREPTPGPHARETVSAIAVPAPLVMPVGVATPTLPKPVTPITQVQPAHAQSGEPVAAVTNTTSPDSRILDRWKDSGKPLR